MELVLGEPVGFEHLRANVEALRVKIWTLASPIGDGSEERMLLEDV